MKVFLWLVLLACSVKLLGEDGAAPKPHITVLNQTDVKAVLQCEVRGAFPKPEVQIQDSEGNIIPAGEPQVTEREGRYDVILPATVTKSDRYRCVSTQEEINYQIDAEICVYIHGADLKPYITTLNHTDVTAQLKRGASPKPEVQWQDRAGNIIPAEEPQVTERGGSYDVILQTTVRKTDHYRCVVT